MLNNLRVVPERLIENISSQQLKFYRNDVILQRAQQQELSLAFRKVEGTTTFRKGTRTANRNTWGF